MKNQNQELYVNSQTIIRRMISFLIVPVFALFIFQSSVVSSFAQMKDEPSAAELEQFRTDFMMTVHNLNASIAKMKRNPKVRNGISESGKNLNQLADIQMQFSKLSYDDLKVIYLSYNTNFPKWRESAGKMEELAEKIGGKYPENYSDENTSSAITPDNCQDAFNEQPSFSDLALTRAFEIEAQAAYEVVPEPLNGIALLAWVPLATGSLALETLNSIYDRCSGDQTDAALQASINSTRSEIIQRVDTNADYVIDRMTSVSNNIKNEIVNNDNTNKTMIVNNDNTNKTTIVDAITNAQTSINQTTNASQTAITTAVTTAKTEIVNNDNSNRTTIINNDNSNALTLNNNLTTAKNTIIANDNTNTTNIVNNDNANTTTLINSGNANTTALNDLILRSQIEADLATESNGVKVAWYMTPTANGGKLDLVKQIVTLTLANIVAAGGSIGNAQSFLDRANADKAAGNFKSAYDNYRKAYKAAGN
jgi:hypothetical protein